jgi:hypothetical protein
MDMTAQTVVCDQHGERHMAFVCQHIAQSMFDQEAVGFFWSREDKSYWPDAWCNECNKRLEINNHEWEGSAAENLGAKLLCGDCYDEAAQLNFGILEWRAAFPDSFTELPDTH